jgi:hypothetical protein
VVELIDRSSLSTTGAHRTGSTVPVCVKSGDLASIHPRQDEHPLDIPGHGHEAPLAAHVICSCATLSAAMRDFIGDFCSN